MKKIKSNIMKVVLFSSIFTNNIVFADPNEEIKYEENNSFYPRIKIVSPEGAKCIIERGQLSNEKHETVPFIYDGYKEKFYSIECNLPNGALWSKKIEGKNNQTATVKIKLGLTPNNTSLKMQTTKTPQQKEPTPQEIKGTLQAFGEGIALGFSAMANAVNDLDKNLGEASIPSEPQVQINKEIKINAPSPSISTSSTVSETSKTTYYSNVPKVSTSITIHNNQNAEMPADKFNKLVSAIKKEAFPSNKMQLLQSVIEYNYFTINQIAQLIDLFVHSSDKVEVVSTCRKKILDPENAFELQSHLTHSSDKEAVMGMF